MSRNNSGTYTLPVGNPVVSGTIITSTWANDTMGDIASALTDSLSRSGKGGMTAPLRLDDGVVSAPGLAFVNETGTGFYRAGSSDVRFALQGTELLKITSIGLTLTSSTAYYPQITLKNTASDGNATYYTMDKSRNGLVVQSGDALGAIVWRGFDGTNFLQAAAIIGYVNGAPGTNDMPGSLGFFTTADGDSSPTRRAYIDSAGDLTLDHINSNTSAQLGNVYADANGKLYKGQQAAAFPSGTVMLFVQTTAPTGWTKQTTYNDRALRVVSGAAGVGGIYTFSSTFTNSNNSGETTLSTAQIPGHNHTGAVTVVNPNGTDDPRRQVNVNLTTSLVGTTTNGVYVGTTTSSGPTISPASFNVASNGSGGSHSHNLALAVAYVDVIIAVKD